VNETEPGARRSVGSGVRRYGHLAVIDGGRATPAQQGPARRAATSLREPISECHPEVAPASRAEPPVLRVLLALGSVGTWVALASLARVPLPVALAAASPLLVASLLAPAWARVSAQRFDRVALSLIAAGRADRLRDRLRRALGLRLFGAPQELAARQGMIATMCGDPIAARGAYARALVAHDDEDRAPVAVRLGHAHACYESGDDVEAEWRYERLLETAGPLPRVRMQLAHARLRRGTIDGRTLALLDAAERDRDAPPAEIALVRAIADALRGRRAIARMRARSVAPCTERERALAAELASLTDAPRRSA
jgi:hypothetical protein